MIPHIIDKITRYFGYEIISRIKIIGVYTEPAKKNINEKKPAPTNSLSQNRDILLAINKNNNKEIKEILISIAQNLQ
jgi:hypothetical protein